MRKFLSALILTTFVIIMQMPFIHVFDMMINNDLSDQAVFGTTAHSVSGDFCDRSRTSTTGSCFTETSESKYLQSVKKIELPLFLFTAIFIGFVSLIFYTFQSFSFAIFKRRILYQETLYLGLYGIIRNIN